MATPARPSGRQVTVTQAVALLLAFVLMAGIGGLLTAGLALPTVAAANGAADLASQTFEDLPSELVQQPLSEKSTMLAADGTVLAEFWLENRIVVSLDQIAPIMQNAVVATEDKRFWEHGAVDPAGMLRAAVNNALSSGGTEGASTLTQQYVKNVLIETAVRNGDTAEAEAAKEADGAEGYARKLREAKLAIALEQTTTKDQILEDYLNIAQFGVNTFGVETAAQRYFSKSAIDLNYLEAATIAGITQSPTALDPVRNPENSEKRRNSVLRRMLAQGYITQDEYDTGVATPLASTLVVSEPKVGCMAAGDVVAGSGYFCDYVTKVIRNDPAFGADEDARVQLLYRGGLTIQTTLDPREQTIADNEVKAGVPVDDSSGVASAISVVEPGTGKITAMAQNRIYNNGQDTPDRQTAVNFNTDKAYGGSAGFAPGSTFKPFTLVEWLKQGHTLNETIDARQMSYPMSSFTAPCTQFGRDTYTFRNAEGGAGIMSVEAATMNSVNSGYIRMASELDLCNIMAGAKSLGVHTGTGADPTVTPANVLGTDSIAPLTMAAAFATFASGGTYCAPIAITSVKDADGNELPIPSANCTQALEPRIANAMNYALSNVWKGTGKAIGAPSFAAAGKTGTTSKNENTWFVGYTPLRAAAVWVGYSEGFIPVQGKTINGKYRKYLFGADVAGPTWKRFMTQAMDGVTVPDFAAAGNDEVYGKAVAIPSVVGSDEATARATLTAAGFTVTVGDPSASSLGAGLVVSQSPSGTAPRGSAVTLSLSTGQAPVAPDATGQTGQQGQGQGQGQGGQGQAPGTAG